MNKTLISLVMLATTTPSFADVPHRLNNMRQSQSNSAFWTPERLAGAISMDILPSTASSSSLQTTDDVPAVSRSGRGPALKNNLSPEVLVDNETQRMFSNIVADTINDNANGSFGTLSSFTTARVTPYYSGQNLGFSADVSYPYSTAGKLFFSRGGLNYVCSASAIRWRIVTTAGHCVHSGNSLPSGWSSNFLFVPSYHSGVAPYLSWTWNVAYTTAPWYFGGGTVPNLADQAIIVIQDQPYNNVVRRIGEVTGYLGWSSNSLNRNHITVLGYPVNLDSGLRMERNDAFVFRASPFGANNFEYGNHMTGGSSGGPLIQNFGEAAIGQTGGSRTARNRVVGVVSYGYTNPTILVQGAPPLGADFIGMYNAACGQAPGNC